MNLEFKSAWLYRSFLALLCLATLGACVQDGLATLKLLPWGTVDVDSYTVRILDEYYREQTTAESAQGTGDIDLGLFQQGDGYRVEIRGIQGSTATYFGYSRELTLNAEEGLTELIPFAPSKSAVAIPRDRAFSEAPRIDGSLREWQASPSLVLTNEHRVAGPAASDLDVRAELSIVWRDDAIHLALLVIDDCPSKENGEFVESCGGSVSRPDRLAIGFDGNYDGGNAFGAGDFWLAIEDNALKVVANGNQGINAADSLSFIYGRHPLGWLVEGVIMAPFFNLEELTVGDRLGIDVVVVDEDPGQVMPTTLRWSFDSQISGGIDVTTPPSQMGTLGIAEVTSDP
jgi:hypothetical protein